MRIYVYTNQREKHTRIMALLITINEYDEAIDSFNCDCEDSLADNRVHPITIPACLMPYIAHDICTESEDLPHGLCGKLFHLTNPVIDIYARG